MRTELGEIENAIMSLAEDIPETNEERLSLVAVVYHKDESSNGVVAGYRTTTAGEGSSVAEQYAIECYLRLGLKSVLPLHMVPRSYIFLPMMPRTASGKTDYKSLLNRPMPNLETGIVSSNSTEELTPVQQAIALIWKSVLQLEGHLSPFDEFLLLGVIRSSVCMSGKALKGVARCISAWQICPAHPQSLAWL
jgi:hypothetical protein